MLNSAEETSFTVVVVSQCTNQLPDLLDECWHRRKPDIKEAAVWTMTFDEVLYIRIPHEALIWSLVSIGLSCAFRRLLPFEVGFQFWAPTLLSWSFDQYGFSLGSVMHIAFLLHCLVQHQLIVIISKLFICSGLPRRQSLVMVVLLANLSALSFPLTSG